MHNLDFHPYLAIPRFPFCFPVGLCHRKSSGKSELSQAPSSREAIPRHSVMETRWEAVMRAVHPPSRRGIRGSLEGSPYSHPVQLLLRPTPRLILVTMKFKWGTWISTTNWNWQERGDAPHLSSSHQSEWCQKRPKEAVA